MQQQAVEGGRHTLRIEAKTSRLPAGLRTALGYLAAPLSPNAGAVLRIFAMMGEIDAVGERVG
ncbi:MAG: hypothetical protein KC731_07555, partial [Myxococcales bacterium]|nr:hypothetical protein [Myxococcales bacterium]